MANEKIIMTNKEFVKKAMWIANDIKTLYVMGCFGAPLNEKNKNRYTKNNPYNTNPTRVAMINNATDDTFGFDCNCLIKGILWGFSADKSRTYGGAEYGSNSVPDNNIPNMKKACTSVSTNMSSIVPGEMLFMEGHVGIYIGDDLVVECTPAWKNCVQIRGLNKTVGKYGPSNKFTSHGKLPWIKYEEEIVKESTISTPTTTKKTPNEIAKEVIRGKWGNGSDRRKRLTEAGYDYRTVQNIVNEMLRK